VPADCWGGAASYEDALRPIREQYGRKALQDLTPEDAEAVKATMLDGSARRVGTPGKPLSARSVNYMIGRLQEVRIDDEL